MLAYKPKENYENTNPRLHKHHFLADLSGPENLSLKYEIVYTLCLKGRNLPKWGNFTPLKLVLLSKTLLVHQYISFSIWVPVVMPLNGQFNIQII